MTFVPKPEFFLSLNGAQLASAISETFIKSLTYQDFHHGQADDLDFEIADPTGEWRGAKRPNQGDIVEAEIGYAGAPKMPCGLFECDSPQAGGSRSGGDTVTVHALAAKPSKELRSKRTEAYENQSLKQIAEKIAGRHGMTVVGEVEDVTFKRKTQRRQRDLEFLTALAEDYGHYFTAKGNFLCFVKRATVEAAVAVRSIDLDDYDTVTNWSAEEATTKTYAKAKLQYLDPDTKKKITAEASDDKVKNGDTLNVDERIEDQAQADKLVKSRLAKANDGRKTASITLVGDPLLVAGQVVELGATFGKYTGRYLITTARHRFNRSGYVTEIELKGLD